MLLQIYIFTNSPYFKGCLRHSYSYRSFRFVSQTFHFASSTMVVEALALLLALADLLWVYQHDEHRNGTVSDHGASNGEHREPLSLMLLMFIVVVEILALLFTHVGLICAQSS